MATKLPSKREIRRLPRRLGRRGKRSAVEAERQLRRQIELHELLLSVLVIGAGLSARKTAEAGWRKTTGNEPPSEKPGEFGLKEGLAWSLASGLLVATARTFVNWAYGRRSS